MYHHHHHHFGIRTLCSQGDSSSSDKTKADATKKTPVGEVKEELPVVHKPPKDGEKKEEAAAGADAKTKSVPVKGDEALQAKKTEECKKNSTL